MIGGLEWGIKQQISEEKNLKESVANIWKHLGGFRKHARWATKFHKLKVSISQPAWCDWLPMAITPSFQLHFVHCLKRWILDFLGF